MALAKARRQDCTSQAGQQTNLTCLMRELAWRDELAAVLARVVIKTRLPVLISGGLITIARPADKWRLMATPCCRTLPPAQLTRFGRTPPYHREKTERPASQARAGAPGSAGRPALGSAGASSQGSR